MDSFITAYIAARMQHLGFKEFHFEPYMVVLNNDKLQCEIKGQNEYYFLTSNQLAVGTELTGDNNHFKVEDYYSFMEINKYQEFTGNIRITSPQGGTQVIEFLRVIPKY